MTRSLSNEKIRDQKFQADDLSDSLLTEVEGANIDTVAGPAIGGSVALTRPAEAIKLILVSQNGSLVAGGAAPAAANAPAVPAQFTLTKVNGDGVGELVEVEGRDYSGATMTVFYQAKPVEPKAGANSSVAP